MAAKLSWAEASGVNMLAAVYLGDSSLPPPAVPPPRTVDDESDSDAEEAIAEEDLLRVM